MRPFPWLLLPALILCGAVSARGQSAQAAPPVARTGQVAAAARPAPPGAPTELPPEKSRPQLIPRFEAAPVIDGRLDDAAWKGALVLKDFYQVYPGDSIKASRETEALLGFD